MVSFLEHIAPTIAATEVQPIHLIVLGLIALVALGSLPAPLMGALSRALPKLARYLGRHLWNIIVEKLITIIALAILALMGSIAWLADVVEVLAMILRY